MNVRNLLIIGFFVGLSAAASGADFSTLEEQMSEREFREAGLHKLSAEELGALNRWLQRREVLPDTAPAAAAAPRDEEDTMGFRPKPRQEDRSTIVSRIDGAFSGWSGRTTFKLENGQVWRQTDGTSFRYNAQNPEVRIEPKFLGTWKLYVEGVNRGVKVTRIE